MDILKQIGIFFGICLVGEVTSALLPIPIPSSVIGMVLLFTLLCCKAVNPGHIQQKSDFLLGNMAFFFIPAGVGILESWSAVSDSVVPLLLICLITTVLTFAATAFTVKGVMVLQERLQKGDGR